MQVTCTSAVVASRKLRLPVRLRLRHLASHVHSFVYLITMPVQNTARPQLKKLHLDDENSTIKTTKYSGTISTLFRLKRKERVPQRKKSEIIDYDTLTEKRYPKARGIKLNTSNHHHARINVS